MSWEFNKNMTRRGFIQRASVAAVAVGLAGCSSAESSTSASDTVHDASDYPIDPDGSDVTALYTSELVGDSRTGDGWTRYVNEDGPTIGVMDTTKIIQVEGYAFKDLNGNGKLDFFEDWRQDASARAEAYEQELSVDQTLGLMLHSDCMSISRTLSKADARTMTVEEALNGGARTFLSFATSDPYKEQAAFNNSLQSAAEALPGSIPASISTNELNFGIFPGNLGIAASFDPELARSLATEMSHEERALGLTTVLGPQIGITPEPRWRRVTTGCGEDPALSRDIARGLLDGYQSSFSDSGEDLGWGTDSMVGMMKHFPGDGAAESGREAHYSYGEFNVYPGDNYDAGLIPFADGAMQLDGKTGSSAACMTSYSIAYSDDEKYGDLVGSAYSHYKLDQLRDDLGFDGLVCTDFGVVEDTRAWGMMDKTIEERIAAVFEAGCDQIGGCALIDSAKEAYEIMTNDLGEDEAEARVRNSGRRVLDTFFHVGLFENPYVESDAAENIVMSEDGQEIARDAQAKTVVMLKNAGQVIQERSDKPTVYLPLVYTEYVAPTDDTEEVLASWSLPFDEEDLASYCTVVTDSVADTLTGTTASDGTVCPSKDDVVRASSDEIAACDFALVVINSPATGSGYDEDTETYIPISLQYGEYVADGDNVRKESIAGEIVDGTKENRSYYGQSTVASNYSDLEVVQDAHDRCEGIPLVVCVNEDRPMVFSEVEPLADAILLGFVMDGTNLPVNAFMDIACGEVEPSALLPIQQPADMDTVEANYEDVPRDLECYEDSEGNVYDFAFGLNWSGVIDDDRTKTYKVSPLSEPETVGA